MTASPLKSSTLPPAATAMSSRLPPFIRARSIAVADPGSASTNFTTPLWSIACREHPDAAHTPASTRLEPFACRHVVSAVTVPFNAMA